MFGRNNSEEEIETSSNETDASTPFRRARTDHNREVRTRELQVNLAEMKAEMERRDRIHFEAMTNMRIENMENITEPKRDWLKK